jgi:N-hydroxyarylamine O-acetyltransferase
LGLEPEPPSVEALARVHRAHVERVPYETVWIHMGHRWGIDPQASLQRVATGRGGYCYHLNGALSTVLEALGYRVTRHVGGVHGPDGPSEDAFPNHLALLVHDLPDDTNPGGTWYVDAGLGDALHAPLPLRPGTYEQAPMRFSLERVEHGVGDWHLTHDPTGSFSGMSFLETPVRMETFEARHEYLSTSPDSGFVRTLTVQRRRPDGMDILRACVLSRRTGDITTREVLDRRRDWFDALTDVFDLQLDGSPEDLDALWERVSATHAAWQRDQADSDRGGAG